MEKYFLYTTELYNFTPKCKFYVKNLHKVLQRTKMYAIIYERDCNRYALKRKVAGGMPGNFRGVCPI